MNLNSFFLLQYLSIMYKLHQRIMFFSCNQNCRHVPTCNTSLWCHCPFMFYNKDQTHCFQMTFSFGFVFIASVQFSTTCLPVKLFLVFCDDSKVWGEVLTFCCVTCSTLKVPSRLSRDSNHIPSSVLVQRLTCEHTHGFNDVTNKNMVWDEDHIDWVHTWCQCQALVVGNNVVPLPRLRGQSSRVQSAVRASRPCHRAATVGLCRFSHFRNSPQSAIVSENEPLLLWVCSSLFRMNWLVSMNRSTQLTKHISALESSFGPGLSIHFSCRELESFREGERHDGCNYNRMHDVRTDILYVVNLWDVLHWHQSYLLPPICSDTIHIDCVVCVGLGLGFF